MLALCFGLLVVCLLAYVVGCFSLQFKISRIEDSHDVYEVRMDQALRRIEFLERELDQRPKSISAQMIPFDTNIPRIFPHDPCEPVRSSYESIPIQTAFDILLRHLKLEFKKEPYQPERFVVHGKK